MPNRPLLITGGLLFGASYIATVTGAARSSVDADKNGYIPVVGPWLALSERPCTFGAGCTNDDQVASGLMIASGVAQGAGVAMAALAFALPEKKALPMVGKAAAVLPMSFVGGAGVGAIGAF